jgi:hypothetical protein
MLELKAGAFISALGASERARATIESGQFFKMDVSGDILDLELIPTITESLRNLDVHLETLGVRLTRTQVSRLLSALEKKPAEIKYGELREWLNSIISRLRDELSDACILVLNPENRRFYSPLEPHFGDHFAAQFPSALFEVDEAAKCFALERPTASVFHLVRVLEVGLKACRSCLGMPESTKPADRNWAAILRVFNDEFKRRSALGAKGWKKKTDKAFFEEVYVSLDAVRNPWRNATMHVESKYLPEEAEHIFVAVRGFMKKVSSRMDERGRPRA